MGFFYSTDARPQADEQLTQNPQKHILPLTKTKNDSQTQRWSGYFDDRDKGKAADKALTDALGIIASMRAPASVRLIGGSLGTNGSSSITLHLGTNLVGAPLKDSRITRVSNLFALKGIEGNVAVIIVSDNGEFKVVARPGDVGDVKLTGGQASILTARKAVMGGRMLLGIELEVGWVVTRF